MYERAGGMSGEDECPTDLSMIYPTFHGSVKIKMSWHCGTDLGWLLMFRQKKAFSVSNYPIFTCGSVLGDTIFHHSYPIRFNI